MNPSTLGLNVISDGLKQALSRRAIQHSQCRGVRLGCKELEDGEHAACADILAVQEAQSVRCVREGGAHRESSVSVYCGGPDVEACVLMAGAAGKLGSMANMGRRNPSKTHTGLLLWGLAAESTTPVTLVPEMGNHTCHTLAILKTYGIYHIPTH